MFITEYAAGLHTANIYGFTKTHLPLIPTWIVFKVGKNVAKIY